MEKAEIIACSGGMASVEGIPEEIKILPLGQVRSQKGDFVVDDESVQLIRQRLRDRGVDLVMDYEHQTLKDVQAPASGWITDIYKGEDAVMAKVSWTERAKEYLKNREYRYLSPVVLVRKSDLKAVALHSVSLTNKPAIDGMFAVVNSEDFMIGSKNEEETSMDLKELAKLLGLPEESTEEEVRAALKSARAAAAKEDAPPAGGEGAAALKEDASTVADPVVLSLLGLKEDATTADVAAAIMECKASGALSEEVKALREQLESADADGLVEKALKDGKITAAQKDWAKSYALSDKDGFSAFLDKAPAVVQMGKADLKDAKEKSTGEVDAAILKACGLTKEDVETYYNKEEA